MGKKKKNQLQGVAKEGIFIVLGIISAIYLGNPGAGIIELIPDNFPIVGNLDEGIATVYLVSVVQRYLGFNPVLEVNKLLGE